MSGEGEGGGEFINGYVLRIGGGRRGGGWGGGKGGGRGRGRGDRNSIGFPIVNEDTNFTMKIISPSVLLNFHGLWTEYPETFLFEFEVLCRSYDYLQDSKKLKLFPATLKDATLKCFMGLITQSIRTWDEMKSACLQKYLDYCTHINGKDEAFKMMRKRMKTWKT